MSQARGGDGIPVELFQILKDDAVKVLHSICQQIWKTQQQLQDWRKSVFIPISKGNAKECSNYRTVTLILHASKVMCKILQARLQQYVNQELPDVQPGFQKGRGTRRPNCQHPWDHRKSKRIPEKTSASLTMLKPLTVENSSRNGNTRPRYLPPEKPVCRSRSNSQNQTWNNGLVPNWERST